MHSTKHITKVISKLLFWSPICSSSIKTEACSRSKRFITTNTHTHHQSTLRQSLQQIRPHSKTNGNQIKNTRVIGLIQPTTEINGAVVSVTNFTKRTIHRMTQKQDGAAPKRLLLWSAWPTTNGAYHRNWSNSQR